jgi:hypothetical protein
VAISPQSVNLPVSEAAQFTARVTGTGNPAVTWFVNDVPGGNSTVGTVSASGLYTAPAVPPSPNTVTVKATSVPAPSAMGTAGVTVSNPAPMLESIAPTSAIAGPADVSLVATGTGFAIQSVVMLGSTALQTTLDASTRLTAVVPAVQLANAGTFPVTVQTPSPGGGVSQSASFTVNHPPAITSATSTTFVVGSAGSFTVAATGFPAPTLSETGSLPGGVTFDSATGVLGGTPGAGTGGTYTITIEASNGVGTDANQTFVLTVDEAPAVTSPVSAGFTAGAAGSFTVTATGYPAPTLSQTGALPSGMTFNPSTGVLSGTPAADSGGTYNLSFKASNGVGTDATQNFTLTVGQTPAITSTTSATFTADVAGSFTVTATGYPAPTLSETGALPAGVSFNASTGTLSGTPAANAGGTYSLSFKASNGVGTDATQDFTLTVNQAPDITSAASATFTVGTAGSLTVIATGYPAPTLSETGALPGGVTFSGSTGTLSGTPTANAGGTYGITFEAANGISPNATQDFTLTVENPAPVLYSVSPPGATAGDGNTRLTLTGSLFTRQSAVYVDATPLTTSYVSPTQTRATVPSTMLAGTGTLTVTVVSPAPGGGSSTGLAFKIWPSYPRSDATSVLDGPPPQLPQLPQTGTLVSVLDWTSKDNMRSPEDVLAADHLLTEMGIPNTDTTDLTTAAGNPFLVVAGVLNTAAYLSQPEVNQLKSYVNGGGTLYLWEPNVGILLSALGIGTVINHAGAAMRPLTFDVSKPDPLLSYIDAPEEVNWQPSFPTGDVTRGYSAGSCTPLATWSTGDYAALRCEIGSGRAYVFGWRLRALLTLPERGLEGPDVEWTNVPVLDADICRVLMLGSYEGYAANPQVREWAPDGHAAALIITHDVDATVSYQNVPAWVDFEESLGVKSTYLFTTNPYDTGYISPMFTPSGRADIQYAINHGFDVQDHSFGHFPDFYVAPYSVGPPTEDASNYLPMFTDNGTLDCCTSGMSVLGEAGVSKWLLETDLGISVTGFRSGFLAAPPDLIRGLSNIGYRRDSTSALALARGSFPFVPFEVDHTVTPNAVITYRLLEYPVTISEDQVPALDSTTINDYLSKWENIIRINCQNHAPTVLLIHPIDTGIRFQILQQLLLDLQSQGLDIWVGDWKTFAEFWEAQGVTNARWP